MPPLPEPYLLHQHIEQLLNTALPGASIVLRDFSDQHSGHVHAQRNAGGRHIELTIDWPGFASMSRIERSRHVHTLLAQPLAERHIHALKLNLSADNHSPLPPEERHA